MTIWQGICFGVYTSEGWPKSLKGQRTFLDDAEKSQKVSNKTKSWHKCHPRIINSSFASSPWQLCEHWKVLFQDHRWLPLENQRKRTKSQWVFQVDIRLARRGNYQWKLWKKTAPAVTAQSLSCWTDIKIHWRRSGTETTKSVLIWYLCFLIPHEKNLKSLFSRRTFWDSTAM